MLMGHAWPCWLAGWLSQDPSDEEGEGEGLGAISSSGFCRLSLGRSQWLSASVDLPHYTPTLINDFRSGRQGGHGLGGDGQGLVVQGGGNR